MRGGFSASTASQHKPVDIFPLSVHSSGRYLIDRLGNPFFCLFDTAWSLAVQLTTAQMDTYFNNRAKLGFTGTIVNLIEHYYDDQTPATNNALGQAPFTTMSPLDFSTPNESYWKTVDYFLEAARNRKMIVIAFPAYLGFQSYEGFQAEIPADTQAHRQAYGVFLAKRYGGYGNIIWGILGDNTASQSLMDNSWDIVTGMRSIRTDQLIYVKPFRESGNESTGSGYSMLVTNSGNSTFATGLARYPGFNINNDYLQLGDEVTAAASEYARSPAYPFFLDEDAYDGAGSPAHTPQDCRHQAYSTYFGGGFAFAFGNNPIWTGGANSGVNAFYTGGDSDAYLGPAAVLVPKFLETTATKHMVWVRKLLTSYDWTKLVPQGSGNFVTSSRGTLTNTVSCALATDKSFGMIRVPANTTTTVDMTQISHSGVRCRWYDPTNGTYTTDGASPLANSGTHNFSTPGANSGGDPDWILVLD